MYVCASATKLKFLKQNLNMNVFYIVCYILYYGCVLGHGLRFKTKADKQRVEKEQLGGFEETETQRDVLNTELGQVLLKEPPQGAAGSPPNS